MPASEIVSFQQLELLKHKVDIPSFPTVNVKLSGGTVILKNPVQCQVVYILSLKTIRVAVLIIK